MTRQTQIGRTVHMLLALSAAAAAGYMLPAAAQETGAAQSTEAQESGSQDGEAQEPAAAGERVVAQADGADTAEPLPEVTITGRQQSAATDVVQERIDLPVVADLVSSEQISRVGDSTVSLALRRLPGVTLVGDQFIYVRGLGERYSSTTLNGAYVPSPDLTRNVIPLDLFPAEIIESLSVSKGYTVDQPAAFGGGNVDIRTLAIPEDLLLRAQIGSGWDTNSSDKGLTYSGGDDDNVGTDDGTRELPTAIRTALDQYQGNISTSGILSALRRTDAGATFADAQAVNRDLAVSLNRDVDLREKSVDPDLTLEGAVGNSWWLGDSQDWKIGVLGLADYKNQRRNRGFERASASQPDTVRSDIQRSVQQVALTGSLNVGLQYTEDHKVQVGGMYLRNTEDDASLSLRNNLNFQTASGQRLREYSVRFEERDLELLQVNGSHTLGADTLSLLRPLANLGFAEDLNFSWYYSDATAQTDIPNEVTIFGVDRIDPASGSLLSTAIQASGSAADYRFTELRDEVKSYGTSLTQPFELGDFDLKLNGGWDYYQKGRRYLETRLGLGATSNGAALAGTPSDVFTDDNIQDPANGFRLDLRESQADSYLAGETINAYFGQFDLAWNKTLRFNGGVRYESFNQLSVPVNQYAYQLGGIVPDPQGVATAAKSEEDYYPAFAVTYMRPDFWAEQFQLRFGWSQTTARPDLREVSDATYIDPLTEFRIRGNPNLQIADLTNYDVRAEWFFANGDNFTISPFYKDIKNPIETVQSAGSDDNTVYSFVNGESAEVFGIEIEWLKRLDFLSDRVGGWADWFFLAGNLTISDSQITVGQTAVGLTNNKHPLSQASEYVANVQVGFDSPNGQHNATLVFNGTGERLFAAGRNGGPDSYEQPFSSLDATYSYYPTDSLSFKLRVQNILGESVSIEQGDATTFEQDIGTTFKVDATMRF